MELNAEEMAKKYSMSMAELRAVMSLQRAIRCCEESTKILEKVLKGTITYEDVVKMMGIKGGD